MKLKKVTTWSDIITCPAIGIDVCKKHLDIAGLREKAGYSRRITNDSRAIAGFIKALVGYNFQGTFL